MRACLRACERLRMSCTAKGIQGMRSFPLHNNSDINNNMSTCAISISLCRFIYGKCNQRNFQGKHVRSCVKNEKSVATVAIFLCFKNDNHNEYSNLLCYVGQQIADAMAQTLTTFRKSYVEE